MSCIKSGILQFLSNSSSLCMLHYRLFCCTSLFLLFRCFSYSCCVSLGFSLYPDLFSLIDLWLLNSVILLLPLFTLIFQSVAVQISQTWSRSIYLALIFYNACFYFVLNRYDNNINGTNFPAPDAHFDNTCLFSDDRCQNIWNPKLI